MPNIRHMTQRVTINSDNRQTKYKKEKLKIKPQAT